MAKTSVVEEKPVQPEAEASAVTCQHHWVIETPRGSMSLGHCKRCGEEREFRNSATDHLWEDESGSGNNGWRCSRPSRAASDDDEAAAARRPRNATMAYDNKHMQ